MLTVPSASSIVWFHWLHGKVFLENHNATRHVPRLADKRLPLLPVPWRTVIVPLVPFVPRLPSNCPQPTGILQEGGDELLLDGFRRPDSTWRLWYNAKAMSGS
jgi:hypothetical protein